MNATPKSLRIEAAKSRRLAADARRLAELTPQSEVRQQMMAQARVLDHAADELEGLAWQYERTGEGDESGRPASEIASLRLQ